MFRAFKELSSHLFNLKHAVVTDDPYLANICPFFKQCTLYTCITWKFSFTTIFFKNEAKSSFKKQFWAFLHFHPDKKWDLSGLDGKTIKTPSKLWDIFRLPKSDQTLTNCNSTEKISKLFENCHESKKWDRIFRKNHLHDLLRKTSVWHGFYKTVVIWNKNFERGNLCIRCRFQVEKKMNVKNDFRPRYEIRAENINL